MATAGMTRFPGGFANGLSVREMPLLQMQPGKVFWVYNGTALQPGQKNGSDGNKGTYDAPFATIDFAIGQCTANRGDIIFVKPGHAETVSAAAGIQLDVAGIAIVGLGGGSLRPTITMASLSTASITVAAANMSIQNVLFTSTVAALATVFDNANTVVATDFSIENCEFRDSSTTLNIVKCFKSGTTANQADGFSFTNNLVTSIMGTPTAATQCILSQAAQARFNITDNVVIRSAALNDTATLLAMGANNHTLMTVARNRTNTPNTSTTAGEMLSGGGTGSSGHVYDNFCWHLAATGLIAPTGTKLAFSQNYCSITGAADKQPLQNPLLV
jgi:hypothetical protein